MYKLLFTLAICCMSTMQGTKPVLIHHKSVAVKNGLQVKLHNYKPHRIDVTYVPQQVVTVKQAPKRLPLDRHTYNTGVQHLKCVLAKDTPQKKADRKTLELLVRKEPLGKTVAQLLDNPTLLKGHEAVVRLYRKVTKNPEPTETAYWKPILTLPETGETEKLLQRLHVSPEGKIHLETANS